MVTYRCLRRLSLGGSLVSAHPLFVLVKRPAPGHHGLEGLAYGRDVLLLLRALETLERLEARVFLGVFIVHTAVHPALLILKSYIKMMMMMIIITIIIMMMMMIIITIIIIIMIKIIIIMIIMIIMITRIMIMIMIIIIIIIIIIIMMIIMIIITMIIK